MRIGIDISQIVYRTGVSTYTENLVKSLLEIDKENQYILFGGSLRKREGLLTFARELDYKYKARVQSRLFRFPPTLLDLLWNRLHIIPVERFIGRVNVFHSSDWVQPPNYSFRVTTIHDLSPLRFPKLTHPKIVEVTQRRLKWVKKEVDRVIVPSQATYEDLLILGFKKSKIRIIPEAADDYFRPASLKDQTIVKKKYKVDDFILAVGTTKRKNLERVISAFDLARAGKGFKLVVVGEKAADLEERRGVVYTGHVSKEDLRRLYSSALCLVYPSLYEGFGLPILEAFACNCPVVTSNTSSLPEVAGNAAIMVDPFSVDSIAQGINKAIKRRKSLIKAGIRRLSYFSWRKTALLTLDVYREALL